MASKKAPDLPIQLSSYTRRVLLKTILDRPDRGLGLTGKQVVIGGWVKTSKEEQRNSGAPPSPPSSPAEEAPAASKEQEEHVTHCKVILARISPLLHSFIRMFTNCSRPPPRREPLDTAVPAEKVPSVAYLVNDGSCVSSIQVVVKSSVAPINEVLTAGTSILAEGVLKQPSNAGKHVIVLEVEKILHIGTVDLANYPLAKTRLPLEFLRSYSHLRPKTTTVASVTRIRNALAYATHTFLPKPWFPSYKPGTSFKFGKVDFSEDYFSRQAYLSASAQLHIESYACALGSVYAFGPAFRTKNSHSPRHLAECWMVELGMAFAELEDVMNCVEDYVKFLCKWILQNCSNDIKLLAKRTDKTSMDCLRSVASSTFERLTYTKAVELLKEVTDKTFETKVDWGIDLAEEHKRYLADEVFKKPVIIYDYPKEVKPFYVRVNDDGKTVAAMDLVLPQVGAAVSGSQKEERIDAISTRIQESGLPQEMYGWYLDLRRHGSVKHVGFSLGFEQMVMFTTGLDDIRDAIPFPRSHAELTY
ncbi:asparagine--tRNA ligase, cytoplasmic 1 isoform X3 [Cinnamomum micranthum f. kanehirae]|uniref:asparagine--tRNA ligase n=1 Tax=Cinnamomum micranthum f. kanehirae TaxID=337451 RepID=A0A443P8W4_9MAGN|nr:asparagine--tRNA ligase, cytoplasmic 1 isoform X3 [Cinnamomum micranthum f. kanehirae]